MMNARRRFRFLNQEEFNALGSQERVDYLREALAPAEGLGDSVTAIIEPAIEAHPTHPSLAAASLRAVESELTASELGRRPARARRLVRREPRS